MRAFYYDTWAFLALANRRDPHHEVAAQLDAALEQARYVAVTSHDVLDETVTGLHITAGHSVALRFLELMEARVRGSELMLVEPTADRREAAAGLFRRLAPDTPRLSLTDCSSMTVMQELGIELAFTADRHFHRAGPGIRPLLQPGPSGLHAPWWPS